MLRGRCAWCLRSIRHNEPVIAIPVWLEDPNDLTGYEKIVRMRVGGRDLHAFVPHPASPGSLQGDVFFMVCAGECRKQLRAFLEDYLRARRPM